MPRETVVHGEITTRYKNSYEAVQELPPSKRGEAQNETYEAQGPDLSVNWNREGEWVQVALIVDRDYLQEYLRTSEDGRMSIPTEVLSRQQINALIRTLRRARNATYGSDE